jgi:AMMECR1 domain-containing protein
VYDWQVGVHGILINFTDAQQRSYTATYLPEVARDHGMTQASAIRELVAKAGYAGPCDQYLIARMSVTRYQTLVETASYNDFLLTSDEEGLAGA